MTITQWQQDNRLLKAARDLRDNNETFGKMMELITDESPANHPSYINQTEAEHSRRLGFIEGYHHLLRVLAATWTKPVRLKEVEATFEPPKE